RGDVRGVDEALCDAARCLATPAVVLEPDLKRVTAALGSSVDFGLGELDASPFHRAVPFLPRSRGAEGEGAARAAGTAREQNQEQQALHARGTREARASQLRDARRHMTS